MKKSISTPNFSTIGKTHMKKSVSTNALNPEILISTLQTMSIAGSSIDDTVCIVSTNFVNNKFETLEFPSDCLHPPDPAKVIQREIKELPEKYIDIFMKRRRRFTSNKENSNIL